mgnify:CR=1 FL=1
MPELPEVETVRRSIAGRVTGERFKGAHVFFAGCVEGIPAEELGRRLSGKRVEGVQRIGKYLVLLVEGGERLAVHLRMTGQLRLASSSDPGAGPYTRLIFEFESGLALRFDDMRKFGRVIWFPSEASLSERLKVGVDPLSAEFTPERFQALLAGRRRPIKSLLLDQELIGGVGNIYADESLFAAGVAPWREAGSLAPQEVEALWRALRETLREGIAHKGTTLRDYVDGDGRPGAFGERLRAYGREGRPCLHCGEPVRRVKIAGRSSFHCPRCQK